MSADDGRRNIFVVGLDDFHERQLATIRNAERYRFHPLLDPDEVVNPERYRMDEIIDEAVRQLERFDGSVDGVIGHWDFPTTSLVPILGRRFGLRTPSLEAALRCEHKYWSRVVQKRVKPEMVPDFDVVNPFADDAWEKLEIEPPFWLKPVKAFSSYLGFRIGNKRDFQEAMRKTREGIELMAEPFNRVLAEAKGIEDLPDVDGYHCIAEKLIGGHQCTLEGYVYEGEVVIYGVIDSIRARNRSSFLRYEYPSKLDDALQQRMFDAAAEVMTEIGYDNGCFNIEFYYDEQDDALWILEINPRLSKSHCPLFELVEGASHHEPAVEIALGERPDYPRGAGDYRHAAKFMVRRFDDAVVEHVATPEEIERIERDHPGTRIQPHVEQGQQLSDLPDQDQDSYSYEVAVIFVGGRNRRGLRDKYLEILDEVDLRYSDAEGDVAAEAAPRAG